MRALTNRWREWLGRKPSWLIYPTVVAISTALFLSSFLIGEALQSYWLTPFSESALVRHTDIWPVDLIAWLPAIPLWILMLGSLFVLPVYLLPNRHARNGFFTVLATLTIGLEGGMLLGL